ncbi:MAG: D-aminoacyl-tRNA deacylase [Candidatus Odinarchaeota archaeon]
MDAVIYSNQDPAGLNIASKLREKILFKKSGLEYEEIIVEEGLINGRRVYLVETGENIINFQMQDIIRRVDSIIFASKHASQTGIPVLTTHPPGNFSTADFGGEPETLAISNPQGMKKALKKMCELNTILSKGYRVSYEVTHHGPTFPKPTMFVEVGGSPAQWKDIEAADIVSHAIIEVLSKEFISGEISIGVGGGHYAPSFTQITLEKDFTIGHIIPKYKLDNIKREVFVKTVNSNLGVCKNVIIDWKGVPGRARGEIVKWSRELGLNIIKTSDLLSNLL